MKYTEVTPDDFAKLDDLEDWRFVLGAIHANFRTGSFPAAATLVSTIVEASEAAGHHPDIDIRYPDQVRVVLTTHATGGVTTHDVELARKFSMLAAQAGSTSEPSIPQGVEIAIDTLDTDRIRPFWAAALCYRDDAGCLVDPHRIGPPVWFQQMGDPRTTRNRLHFDIHVPHDVAETRIAAALAAGGTLVSDRFAPSWWILADADGNEACICTWQDC